MLADWNVMVVFSGLILFVQDPLSKTITHALLADGRAEKHHLGSILYDDTDDCDEFVRSDFDHRPLVTWGVGGVQLADRSRICLVWLCNGMPCEPNPCASPGTSGACPHDGSRQQDLERCDPDPRFGQKLPKLADRNPEQERSYFWVPPFVRHGMPNPVPKRCSEPGRYVPSVIFAQVPLRGGTIRNGGFAWIEESSSDLWIPELKFGRTPSAREGRRRAAAEIVTWEIKAPENATELRLERRNIDGTAGGVFRTFIRDEGTIKIHISNSPSQRCHGRIHPGRMPGATTGHFEMFYDMFSPHPPAFGGTGSAPAAHTAHMAPGRKRIPWSPPNLRSEFPKNVVPFRPFHYGNIDPRDLEGLGLPVGTTQRPLCIPGVANAGS